MSINKQVEIPQHKRWCYADGNGQCLAINEAKIAQNVKKEHFFYKEILSAFPDMVWAKDKEGNYLYANTVLCENLLMCTTDEALGNNDTYFAIRERTKHQDKPQWHTFGELCFDSDKEVLRQEKHLKFLEYGNIKGNLTYLEVHKAPFFGKDGHLIGTVGVGRDVTEIELIKRELKQKAFYDELTKLPNRFVLENDLIELLEAHSQSDKIAALMFLDIDDFKYINNEYGHSFGDEFLISLSQRLKEITKSSNSKIFRFNGDEFAILVNFSQINLSLAKKEILKIAEEIKNEASKELYLIKPHKKRISATCSIGIYIIDSFKSGIGYIKSCADIAKNEAKSRGKNRVVIFEEIQRTTMVNMLDTQKRINKGLEKREFSLHYQPQYKITEDGTQQLIGAEALIRWHLNDMTLSPAYFIDIAEKSGQIIKLGQWILEEGFKTLELWSKSEKFKSLTLAINVSPRQFHNVDFIEDIIKLKEKFSFDISRLKIEITENIAIQNSQETKEKMKILLELGISLSLDDFGTGYSSLSNLRNLPFSQIKIDKSFVGNITTCTDSRQIIKSISDITKQMNKTLIIEGVETKEQLYILLEIGVNEFQGYLLGKPMPLEEFEALGFKNEE